MRKFFYFFLMIFFSFFLSYAKGPEISFEKKVVDVGKVPVHTKVTGIFKFKNVGDKKLIIFMVKPG